MGLNEPHVSLVIFCCQCTAYEIIMYIYYTYDKQIIGECAMDAINIVIAMEKIGVTWTSHIGGPIPHRDRVCLVHPIYHDAANNELYIDEYGHQWSVSDIMHGEYTCSDDALEGILTKANWPPDAVIDAINRNIGWCSVHSAIRTIDREVQSLEYIVKYLSGHMSYQNVRPFIFLTEQTIIDMADHFHWDAKGNPARLGFMKHLLSFLGDCTTGYTVAQSHDKDAAYMASIRDRSVYANSDPLLGVSNVIQTVIDGLGTDGLSRIRHMTQYHGAAMEIGEHTVTTGPLSDHTGFFYMYISGGSLGKDRVCIMVS